MFLAVVWQSRLQGDSPVVEHGFVGIVVAGSRDELVDFRVFERPPEFHLLHREGSTSLPLPKLKPLCSSFLN
jgi:hypothetical protein